MRKWSLIPPKVLSLSRPLWRNKRAIARFFLCELNLYLSHALPKSKQAKLVYCVLVPLVVISISSVFPRIGSGDETVRCPLIRSFAYIACRSGRIGRGVEWGKLYDCRIEIARAATATRTCSSCRHESERRATRTSKGYLYI
jgi:hypothetical protein